jgi:hypothetical protein
MLEHTRQSNEGSHKFLVQADSAMKKERLSLSKHFGAVIVFPTCFCQMTYPQHPTAQYRRSLIC